MKMLTIILSLCLTSVAPAEEPAELLQGMKIDAKEWLHPAGLNARKQINQYQLYGVVADGERIIEIDPMTGESTIIGQLGIAISMSSLGFDHQGELWGLSYAHTKNGNPRDRQLVLYRINLKTGAGTEVQRFKVPLGTGMGVGFEFSKDGSRLFWCNSRHLMELHKASGKVTEIMRLPLGSFCLARHPNGNLLTVGISKRQLIEIDIKKRKVVNSRALNIPKAVPSLAITPDSQLFIETFGGKLWHMKNLQADPVLIGQTGLTPWGLAIRKGNKHK